MLKLLKSSVSILVASTGLLTAAYDARASSNFVQAYLDANGGCASSQSPLSFVLTGSGTDSPFGKPAEDWTETDLTTMRETLERCVTIARTKGRSVNEMRNDLANINARVPDLINRAKKARDVRLEHEKNEANQRERQRQAILRYNEMQKEAWARTEERLRNPQKYADPCTAGVPGPSANLGPNGPTIREKFDKAIAECRRRTSEAAASRNRAQQQFAERRERDRVAALRAKEAHQAYLAEHNLTEVTVVDLQTYGARLINKRVAVTGFVKVFNEDQIVIYSRPSDFNGVPLDLTNASPSARRLIFSNCSDTYQDCRIEIDGIVGFSDHVFVKVM